MSPVVRESVDSMLLLSISRWVGEDFGGLGGFLRRFEVVVPG